MAEETVFLVPTQPQEFGVVLTPAELRRINFSALDFVTLRRALVEYIKTYFPEDFNDFVASNGVIMFTELVAAVGNILSERSDILVDESFLPTAQTKEAVINHLRLINQEIQRATPAIVDLEATIGSPSSSDVNIPAGLRFSLAGADGRPLTYELFRAPSDFTSSVTIPRGRRGVIGFGIEGRFADPIIVESAGGTDQVIEILDQNVIDEPIIVEVATDEDVEIFTRVEAIERFGPNDSVFEVRFQEDRARVVFGDDVTGKAPLPGQIITVRYRIGGGIRGRIGSSIINEARAVSPDPPVSAPIEVLFRNPQPSSGGTDEETLEAAKARAPKDAATLNSATTGEDYAQLSKSFTHPHFGSVLKSVAVLRTGVEGDLETLATAVRDAPTVEAAAALLDANFINRNIVELYVLAEGPDGIPVKPSTGLKQGLETFFRDLAVLTDEVRALDGEIKAVDVEASIIISRTADAGTIRESVNTVIDDFFALDKFDMGQGFNLSTLYSAIQNVPGVKFVTIFDPVDDILSTGELAEEGSAGIGFNELLTLGEKNLQFFFEKGAAQQLT
jgi:hypothetical protein